jgi:phospholipid/cholesterol/gamma-HCH transport system substrate-binding protein
MNEPGPASRGLEQRRAPFLFVGSGLLLTAALLVGLTREQGWGRRHLTLELLIGNATGVRVGQDVRISGLPVGQVRSIILRPDARVQVQLQVAERFASLVGPRSGASLRASPWLAIACGGGLSPTNSRHRLPT